MDNLKPFTTSELNLILNKRPKETKLGERVVRRPDALLIWSL
jgi:formiminoglutamase